MERRRRSPRRPAPASPRRSRPRSRPRPPREAPRRRSWAGRARAGRGRAARGVGPPSCPRSRSPPVSRTLTARAGAAVAVRALQSSSRSRRVRSRGIRGSHPVAARSRRGIADLRGHVGGTEPLGVHAHLDVRARRREEEVEQLPDAAPAPAAHVVDGARRPALLEQHPVGAHHVAHVGEVAHRLEVADLQHGGPPARLDLGDLAGERALREGLARAPGPVWWKVRVRTTRRPPAGP